MATTIADLMVAGRKIRGRSVITPKGKKAIVLYDTGAAIGYSCEGEAGVDYDCPNQLKVCTGGEKVIEASGRLYAVCQQITSDYQCKECGSVAFRVEPLLPVLSELAEERNATGAPFLGGYAYKYAQVQKPAPQFRVGDLVWCFGRCRRIKALAEDGDIRFEPYGIASPKYCRPVRVGDKVVTTGKGSGNYGDVYVEGEKATIVEMDIRGVPTAPIALQPLPKCKKSHSSDKWWVESEAVRLAEEPVRGRIFSEQQSKPDATRESVDKAYLLLRSKLAETNRRLNKLEERIKTLEKKEK